MSRQTNILVEEVFMSKNPDERKQKVNEIFLQIIKKSELHKVS
jgi:hypothetical protein